MKQIIKKFNFIKMEYIFKGNVKNNDYSIQLITKEDVNKLPKDYYSVVTQKKILKLMKQHKNHYRGYKLLKDNIIMGYCFVLDRGYKETFFTIKNSDFYLSNVYIKKEYRGHGLVNIMINLVCNLNMSIGNKISLVVNDNNFSAIKAYKKIGFKEIGNQKFIRIIKMNIPFRSYI